MKFSEAIRLGSLSIKPIAFTRGGGRSCLAEFGCALGMAEFAVYGKKRFTSSGLTIGDEVPLTMTLLCAERQWPWIDTIQSVFPCGCKKEMCVLKNGEPCCWMHLEMTRVLGIVVHLFNHHVMTDKTWTIDRLCEWVASVEPKEEEPKSEISDLTPDDQKKNCVSLEL